MALTLGSRTQLSASERQLFEEIPRFDILIDMLEKLLRSSHGVKALEVLRRNDYILSTLLRAMQHGGQQRLRILQEFAEKMRFMRSGCGIGGSCREAPQS